MLRGSLYRKANDFICAYHGVQTVTDAYNELKKLENYDVSEVQAITLKKIRSMLIHASKNVPYYKETFKDNHVDIQEIVDYGDLEKIPVLDKKSIRDNFPEKIIDSNIRSRARYYTTSGSTGEPVEFYRDYNSMPCTIASMMFFNNMMGVDNFDVHWNLKNVGNYSNKQKLIFWLVGKHYYSIRDVKKENLAEIVNQFDTVRPGYLEVYAASCEKLARLLEQEGMRPEHKPKAIISTSETLTEQARELIERVFESEVFDRYGHLEFSAAVAQECGMHDGYHINPLLTHIEIVDENDENVSEGEEGKILITDLNNRVMPFIRYDVGDLGVKGADDCPCGLNFPVLKELRGRTGEFIHTLEGEKIAFPLLNGLMRGYAPYVYTFQFIQHTLSDISLKVVPTKRYTKNIEEEILENSRKILPSFEIEIKIVDDIPPEASGKTPFLKKMINSVIGRCHSV